MSDTDARRLTAKDLKRFCSTDEYRQHLHQPWSAGEWTYATNGHIAVRVPRLDGVPENDKAPTANILKIFDFQMPPMRPLNIVELPTAEETECEECDGRGRQHTCPDCQCPCPCQKCDGSGVVLGKQCVLIGTTYFDVKYIRLLFDLRASVPVEIKGNPMPFIFDGGVGVLMALFWRYGDFVDIRV